MSVRRELLERELKKLGYRRNEADGGAVQQQQGAAGHPQAVADNGGRSS